MLNWNFEKELLKDYKRQSRDKKGEKYGRMQAKGKEIQRSKF